MSPQSIKQSDELYAAIQTPNSTRRSTPSKRPNTSEDNDSADDADNSLSAIKALVDVHNKRHKHKHNIILNVQSTQTIPIDPILLQNDVILQSANEASRGAEGEGEGESNFPIDPPIQAPRQEQCMASRPPLTSTQASSLSTLESQNLAVFSPKEKNFDTQSVYSHTTAQSTYTDNPPGGKSCQTCVKHLTTGFFSSWKTHFWTIHCPREVYYCFGCKIRLLQNEESGTLSWQCNKCSKLFENDFQAVVHFTDRNLPCHDRFALFAREKPFRDHLQKKHIRTEFLNGSTINVSCNLCDETFTDRSQSKQHKCYKAAGWKYRLTTPVNVICDWHPDLVLETEKQVNDHFQSEHFGNRQRKNLNGGSTLGDDDSRHDAYSVDGNDHGSSHQQHGHLLPGPLGSEAVYSSQAEGQSQPYITNADVPIVLYDNDLGSNPQPYYSPILAMEGDTGSSSSKLQRVTSLVSSAQIPAPKDPKAPPPLLTNVVTEGGKAKFLTRPNLPP